MSKSGKRVWVPAICLMGFVLAVALRIYPEFVPWGASILPFTLAKDRGPTLTSPSGEKTVRVYFNDAGAMHSGKFWTWVVEDHWLIGPRVVAEGYVSGGIRYGDEDVPIVWGEDDKLHVTFSPSRYDN